MINRVIVGVDFSDASRTALEQGAAWAGKLGKPLLAVHVLQPPAPMLPEAQIALPDPAWLQSMEDHALLHLRQWTEAIPDAAVEVRWGQPGRGTGGGGRSAVPAGGGPGGAHRDRAAAVRQHRRPGGQARPLRRAGGAPGEAGQTLGSMAGLRTYLGRGLRLPAIIGQPLRLSCAAEETGNRPPGSSGA